MLYDINFLAGFRISLHIYFSVIYLRWSICIGFFKHWQPGVISFLKFFIFIFKICCLHSSVLVLTVSKSVSKFCFVFYNAFACGRRCPPSIFFHLYISNWLFKKLSNLRLPGSIQISKKLLNFKKRLPVCANVPFIFFLDKSIYKFSWLNRCDIDSGWPPIQVGPDFLVIPRFRLGPDSCRSRFLGNS